MTNDVPQDQIRATSAGAVLPAIARDVEPEVQSRRPPSLAAARVGIGLLLLISLGLLLEGLILFLWPLSFDLTQGADFSYEYLVQYEQVWEWFRPLLQRFETLFPTAATSLEQLTAMLSIFWVASFACYLAAFFVARVLPQRWWLVAVIVACMLVFQVSYFLMPGTFTTDLFSYAMYGYIPRVYELNPYIYVPGYFPDNRMTSWIHPVWYYTPSIYGPIWIDFSVWLTGFTRDRSLVDQALAYRLTSALAHLVNVGLAGLLLRKLKPRLPVSLLLLFAWNPLLLFEFSASGHNDSVMLLFLLVACLFVAHRQWLLSVIALTSSILVKMTPVMVLPLLLLAWASTKRSWLSQFGVVALGGLSFLALTVLLYAPWYSGPDTFLLIEYWSKGPMYLNYVPDLIAGTIADQILDPGRLDQQTSWEAARTMIKWVTRIIFVAYFAWEAFRLWRPFDRARSDRGENAGRSDVRQDLLAAMCRVFLVFLLLVNTWVLPWYLTWPFVLTVALGWERLETRVATGFTFSAPFMMYNHHYWSIHMAPWLYLAYLSPLLLIPLPWIWRRLVGNRGAPRQARREDAQRAAASL